MKYAAFFRGINIGGRNIVKMDDLKSMFAGLGYTEVKTYIQSGNVVFSSDDTEADIAGCIAAAFEKLFGFPSAVILRTAYEIAAIVGYRPFLDEDITEAERHNPEVVHLYVYLAETSIDSEEAEKIASSIKSGDKIFVSRREIFLLCRDSVRNSKLAAALGKLRTPLTARNMKTMNKIRQMLVD